MPPTLIIDGYNLIRNSPLLAPIDRRDIEEGREALISRLADYRKVRRLPIIVVFDGTASYHLSAGSENRMGLKILFSRQGQTADDYIVSLALGRNGNTVVVTSDRDIHHRLRAADCVCLTSEAFEAKIDAALFELFKGISASEENDGSTRGRGNKRTTKRLPKKVRRQRNILSKL